MDFKYFATVLFAPIIMCTVFVLKFLCHALYLQAVMIMIPVPRNKFAGHLDFAGFYFLNAPLILNAPINLLLDYRPTFSSCDRGIPSLNIL
jgi:hypothetical protein